jgi:SulP family sulfate permease
LDLEDVPTLDMTGLISLETTLRWLWEAGVSVIIADAKGHTKEVLIRGGLIEQTGKLLYANEVAPAIKMAHDVIKSDLSDLYKLR